MRVQHAEEWLASVHTLGMPKPVITCVLKVLRNGLLLYLPLHVPKPVCVQSASQKRVSKTFQNRNNDGRYNNMCIDFNGDDVVTKMCSHVWAKNVKKNQNRNGKFGPERPPRQKGLPLT